MIISGLFSIQPILPERVGDLLGHPDVLPKGIFGVQKRGNDLGGSSDLLAIFTTLNVSNCSVEFVLRFASMESKEDPTASIDTSCCNRPAALFRKESLSS